LVHWLGFRGCTFSSLLHANNRGNGGVLSTDDTELDLGPNCRYNGTFPTQ
jgi:hypothetical protein